MEIQYTEEAIADLVRLREFISHKNPYAARRVATELLAGVAKLKVFPKMGVPVNMAPDSEKIRDLFIIDYTVRYLVQSQEIIILRIWHDKEGSKNLVVKEGKYQC